MSIKSIRGKVGEAFVCEYLEERGWKIEDRNYRVRGGEIDIIASRSGIMTFVEVKTRKFGSLDNALEAIDRRKQRLIVRAADRYLEDHRTECSEIRFDAAAVVITTEDEPRLIEVKYYENAFDAFSL